MVENALKLYQTTVGKKAIMGASGLAILGFVFAHMLGNLGLYAGADAMNDYAAWLRTLPFNGLNVLRAGLIAAIVAHIVTALQLVQINDRARPQQYKMKPDLATNYAAKTMKASGPILAFYILFHLAHLTWGWIGAHDPHNVYNNLVYGFQNPLITGLYIVANLFLGVHLYHGAWSMFQSLGINHPRYNDHRRKFATAFAALSTAANVSFAVSSFVGLVKPEDTTRCHEVLASEAHPCPNN